MASTICAARNLLRRTERFKKCCVNRIPPRNVVTIRSPCGAGSYPADRVGLVQGGVHEIGFELPYEPAQGLHLVDA